MELEEQEKTLAEVLTEAEVEEPAEAEEVLQVN